MNYVLLQFTLIYKMYLVCFFFIFGTWRRSLNTHGWPLADIFHRGSLTFVYLPHISVLLILTVSFKHVHVCLKINKGYCSLFYTINCAYINVSN